ncbi:hypothetical protein BGZ59_007108 [Podila verticillata]|nr:hypothetical protein BGZ59_007108 [Podila verticillata]
MGKKASTPSTEWMHLQNPKTIVKHLDEYVIGQERAKKILAVAVYNHYSRVNENLRQQQVQESLLASASTSTSSSSPSSTSSSASSSTPVFYGSSILLTEPPFPRNSSTSGTGRSSSSQVSVVIKHANPFTASDATPFTQAGYVGEDVEMVIHRLLQNCDYNIKKAECGIVFIDEIDKISKRPDAMSISKDNGPSSSSSNWNGSGPSGTTGRKGGLPGFGSSGSGSGPGVKGEVYAVDTSNILFVLSGAFIGLEKIVMDRVSKGSIGFDAVVRAPSSELEHAKDGTRASRFLDQVDPADLIKFGLIPEFIGRLPVVAAVNHLNEQALVRILTEPRNSLVKQYQGLFGLGEIKIHFSMAALHAIAGQAIKKQTGARGLRRIMESLLLDVMYDAPGSAIKHIVIDLEVVQGKKPALCFSRGDDASVEEALVRDDVLWPQQQEQQEQREPIEGDGLTS